MTTKFSQETINRIKKEARKPLPRWYFLLRRTAVWVFFTASLAAAGIFLGSLFSDLIRAEWLLAPRWPGQTFGFIYDTVAGIWVLGALAALIGAILFFRSTRHGYRYGVVLITTIVAITTLTTGVFLLPTHVPERLREWHEEFLPPEFTPGRFHIPQEGRLMGELTSLNADTGYLEDINDNTWELWFFEENPTIKIGDQVMAFGETMDDRTFAVFRLQQLPNRLPDFP